MTPVENEQIREALHALSVNRRDNDAWRILINVTFPIALATANRILHGMLDLARDATWEAFARIARYADFDILVVTEPTGFLRYLKQVTRRTSYDLLQSLARRSSEIQSGLVVPEGGVESRAPTPEETLAADELRGEILKMLNHEDQRLLKMVLDGFSLPEIAERIGISYNATGVRLHRLRQKVRNYLIEEGL